MNKKIVYWVVGVVVVLVLIWVFVGKSTGTPVSEKVTAKVARQSVLELLGSGATETCTFSIPATATSSAFSGTVYLSTGNMRADFNKTDSANKVTSAHMIITGGMDYIWSDAMSKGIKLSMALASSSSSSIASRAGIDLSQPTEYTCDSKTPDQSLFTLPANMTFTDVSSLLRAYGGRF